MRKVIVGMSGGVDSSIAAYLLKQEGYEVEGVSFMLWEARNRRNFTACCSLEAASGARETAGALGIVHTTVDVRAEFMEKVIEPFVDAYVKGTTPNPCILCNRHVKFPFLLREALKRGAEYIATGHYGTTDRQNGKAVILRKGIDSRKDQSYVLYALRREELERLVLPLGRYRKERVRKIALERGLDAADRPESQEICFIEDRDYAAFIERLFPSAASKGPIMNREGKVIGTHKGVFHYTVGQRKGLGLSSLSPSYVTGIDSSHNIVFVGPREETEIREIFVEDIHWLIEPPAESRRLRAAVKVRSMMEVRPASVELMEGGARVVFDEPQFAPAPGQSAVFYDGDIVMGGGVIVRSFTI